VIYTIGYIYVHLVISGGIIINIKKTSKEISKELNRIENSINRKLNSFYNSVIKGSMLPIESLQQKHAATIKNIIRKTVQDSYLYGSKIVTKQASDVNTEFVDFVSVTDIQNIQNITERVSAQFWKTAGRLHRREQDFILTPDKQLDLKPAFDTTAAMIGLGSFAVFNAFNNASFSKLQQIATQEVLITAEGRLNITGRVLFGPDFADLGIIQGRVTFVTQRDDKVDPDICAPLEGTQYDIIEDAGDPVLEQMSTYGQMHNHCRCILVPSLDVDVAPESER